MSSNNEDKIQVSQDIAKIRKHQSVEDIRESKIIQEGRYPKAGLRGFLLSYGPIQTYLRCLDFQMTRQKLGKLITKYIADF